MKYSVEISVEAENDIEDIYRYIAFNLCSLDNAAGQVDRLYKMIFSLDEMPFRFRRFPRKDKGKDELRIVSVNKYCIFYIVDEMNRRVIIVRVLYGSRNLYGETDIEDL
ncbi:MAG: type II toxin-antitoxin system RelE/ParE family toxin [Clostridia bacterium]|nr:type II toxin-antitoxin system RelE/ParE family toxin [Clostridia bacterium]